MAPMTKKEERYFMIQCIELYQSLPALWNTKCREYSNRNKKEEQYQQLLLKYKEKYPDATKSDLIKKFNSLRTNFRKELKRLRSSAGTGDVEESTLWYFNEMKFLADQKKPAESTMRIKEEQQIEAENVIEEDNSSESNVFVDETFTARQKDADALITSACKCLQQPPDEFEKIASAWAVDLKKMNPQQQLFAKKAISDILFEGQMGTLHRDSVQIN